MKTKISPYIGKSAVFVNKAHYPSLHRKLCTIVSDHGENEHYRFGVKFEDGSRMAAAESEVILVLPL